MKPGDICTFKLELFRSLTLSLSLFHINSLTVAKGWDDQIYSRVDGEGGEKLGPGYWVFALSHIYYFTLSQFRSFLLTH